MERNGLVPAQKGPPFLIEMPRAERNEILIRLACNALAVAIHHNDREEVLRPAAPHYLERPRPAPGMLLRSQIEKRKEHLEDAHWRISHARVGGNLAEERAARIQAEFHARKLAQLVAELVEVRTYEGAGAHEGAFVLQFPSLELMSREGRVTFEPTRVALEVSHKAWVDLKAWRHSNAVPTLHRSVYRLRRKSFELHMKRPIAQVFREAIGNGKGMRVIEAINLTEKA